MKNSVFLSDLLNGPEPDGQNPKIWGGQRLFLNPFPSLRLAGRISVFGQAVETKAFLETAAGRARRSARAANVAKHALGLSGARGATRPTSRPSVLDRSESETRPDLRRLKQFAGQFVRAESRCFHGKRQATKSNAWSQRRLPVEFMDDLSHTTIIRPAEPFACRRGSLGFA